MSRENLISETYIEFNELYEQTFEKTVDRASFETDLSRMTTSQLTELHTALGDTTINNATRMMICAQSISSHVDPNPFTVSLSNPILKRVSEL